MNSQNRFIVLEGLDGVGKSTLARNLAAQLKGVLMSTPGEAFKTVRNQAMEAFAGDELAKALFYSATVSSEGRKARSITNQGKPVVMDRYWASTVSYAIARGVSANLDCLGDDLVRPDITVLITLGERTRLERLQHRGMTAEDRETFATPFMQTVLRELEVRSDITVDITGLTPDDAVKTVASRINGYFGSVTPAAEALL